MALKEIKKEFSILEKKYKLPSFNELIENFEVDKIEKETETLLRSIRKVMMEKVLNSMSFAEMLLNPMSSPGIYLPYIKSMSSEDKNKIEKIYKILGEVSMVALENEILYSEKKEAELIKEIAKRWKSIQEDFLTIINNIKNPSEGKPKRDRIYLG